MFKMKIAFFSLLLAGSAISAADLTLELKKLNEASESERHFCSKLEKELKDMDVFIHDANPNGPSFKSKELALRSLKLLTENDLGLSQNTSKAYQLLSTEETWPEDNYFFGELGKINPECAIFDKHNIFWAYSLDHKKFGFSGADHNLFKEQFRKYIESGLKVPGPYISLLIRVHDLSHFTRANLIGSKADIAKVESLKNEMEQQSQKLQASVKSRKAGSWIMKEEIELYKRYMAKFKALYSSMK